MNKKARLTELASRISEKPKEEKRKEEKHKEEKKYFGNTEKVEPNPPHGEKGDFIKVTVTLPPAIYELIAQEATRRKMAKEPNPLISAVIREAIVEKYLEES